MARNSYFIELIPPILCHIYKGLLADTIMVSLIGKLIWELNPIHDRVNLVHFRKNSASPFKSESLYFINLLKSTSRGCLFGLVAGSTISIPEYFNVGEIQSYVSIGACADMAQYFFRSDLLPLLKYAFKAK